MIRRTIAKPTPVQALKHPKYLVGIEHVKTSAVVIDEINYFSIIRLEAHFAVSEYVQALLQRGICSFDGRISQSSVLKTPRECLQTITKFVMPTKVEYTEELIEVSAPDR